LGESFWSLGLQLASLTLFLLVDLPSLELSNVYNYSLAGMSAMGLEVKHSNSRFHCYIRELVLGRCYRLWYYDYCHHHHPLFCCPPVVDNFFV
jgi:hypothetical protein